MASTFSPFTLGLRGIDSSELRLYGILGNSFPSRCAAHTALHLVIPDGEKGEGKFYRKATPGGWREDLTPKQARVIEEVTRPLLEEFYGYR